MTQTEQPPVSSGVGKWKAYPAYRDSGVEWLGEIPEHWAVERLKFNSYVKGRIGWQNLRSDEFTDEGPYLITGMHFDQGSINWDACYHILKERYDMAPEIQIREHDVLITKDGSIGKVAFIDHLPGAASLNSHLLVIRPLRGRYVSRFIYYLLGSSVFRLYILVNQAGSTFFGISQESVVNFPVIIPSLTEQHNIAAFLDRETTRINTLIAKKERLIELLQEKRAALISHTVTKGLDAGVKMKDSGVEWLGEIPEHWEIRRVCNVTKLLQTGPFGSQLHSSDYSSNGIPVINPSHLRDGCIYPDWDCSVDEEIRSRLSRHTLRKGDIVFARRGEMGRCALVTEIEEGWLCGTGSLLMRPDTTLSAPSFLNKVLSIEGVKDWLLLESVGSTMDNLNTDILSRIPLPIPPLTEQYAIVKFINQETSKIDALISRIRKGIEKLKEYSTALISAAVTGKIDVREDVGNYPEPL